MRGLDVGLGLWGSSEGGRSRDNGGKERGLCHCEGRFGEDAPCSMYTTQQQLWYANT